MKIATATQLPYRPIAIRNDQYDFDVTAIAQAYVDKVEVLGQDHPDSSSLELTSYKAAYQLAASLVGGPAAVALAGDVLVELCNQQCKQELDQGLNKIEGIVPDTKLAGTDVMIGFGNPEELGQAKYTSITLDPQLKEHLGGPLGDFIAGHELGHLKKDDMLRRMGQVILQAGVEDEDVASEVEQASQSLARTAEFQADMAGLDYALSRGHSKEQLLQATTYLMSLLEPEGDATHPSTELRLSAIEKKLNAGEH